jgi:ABC-type Na+ efflux pump permease subunit
MAVWASLVTAARLSLGVVVRQLTQALMPQVVSAFTVAAVVVATALALVATAVTVLSSSRRTANR